VLAFELLSGQRCFHPSNEESLRNCIEQGQWRFPKDFAISLFAKHFVCSLLQVDPGARPSTKRALKLPGLLLLIYSFLMIITSSVTMMPLLLPLPLPLPYKRGYLKSGAKKLPHKIISEICWERDYKSNFKNMGIFSVVHMFGVEMLQVVDKFEYL
ncbi:hypothetical protein RFI_18083, partial [Reticulomyxa filosa]